MAYCFQCGKMLPPGAIVCNFCGAQQVPGNMIPPHAPQQPAPQRPVHPPQPQMPPQQPAPHQAPPPQPMPPQQSAPQPVSPSQPMPPQQPVAPQMAPPQQPVAPQPASPPQSANDSLPSGGSGWVPPLGSLGGIDVMATDAKGLFVLSEFQLPANMSSAAQMGMSALQTATKGKYAWAWFLIPAVTILAFLIDKIT